MQSDDAKKVLVAAFAKKLVSLEQLADGLLEAGAASAMGVADLAPMVSESIRIAPEKMGQLAALMNQVAHNDDAELPEHPATLLREAYDTERLQSIGDVDPRAVDDKSQRYLLGRELGRGGAGLVKMAWDKHLRRVVALKTPLDALPQSELDRFLSEAQTTGGLEHPSIVPIYDLGILSEGEIFYTMKYVRKHSLREMLDAHCRGDEVARKEFGLYRMLTVLQQVCMAIHYAHVKGVLHRDLKPDNIMVGEYGEVFVMDWGLAMVRKGGVLAQPKALTAEEEADQGVSGTPEYMSPEQARGDNLNTWSTSDVFSLGAVLYEMLTLHPPHRGTNQIATLMQAIKCAPEAPQKRAPYRSIPAALEAICMKALAKRPTDRYQSAKELHDELDAFVQGRKDQERRDIEAQHLVSDGDRHSQRYFDLRNKAQRRKKSARKLAHGLRGHAPLDEKRQIWASLDEAEGTELEAIEQFSAAESAYFGALAHDPGRTEARLGLASLYYARFQQAEAHRDARQMVYFKNRLREFDDGAYGGLIEASGRASFRVKVPEAVLRISRFEEKDRRLIPLLVAKLEADERDIDVPRGSYLAEVTAQGYAKSSVPFVVERGETNDVRVELVPSPAVSENFIFVPGGPTHIGGDELALNALMNTRVDVPGFCIGRYPVTFGEYIEFLDDLSRHDHARAIEHIPRTAGDGMLCIQHADGSFRPSDRLIEGPSRQRYPKGQGHEYFVPVYGVAFHDAIAFAQWRSGRDRRAFRLPTEAEWEKAARGVDGRFFPWGNTFDAGFCKMYDSRPGMAQPEPVGVFEYDSSPYGVRDMAGGIREWVADVYGTDPTPEKEASQRVVRGGAWALTEHFVRVGSRFHMLDKFRNPVVGFRLAHDV